ncbi:MAG: hypothetical protein VR70_10995 [Rhodospirillaceae bacterium BRH_c57]|nr:MAG: hypothetical protein VR70_10995 [Rhodospirillaceae bacterium BRH_c57]
MNIPTCTAYLSCIEYAPNGDGTTQATIMGAMVEIDAATCLEAYQGLQELHEDGLIEFVWQPADDPVTISYHVDAGRTHPCLDVIDGPDRTMEVDDFLC